MNKALKTGIAALCAAAVAAGAGAGIVALRSGDIFHSPAAYAAVLKQGARGGEVKEVQRRLKNWG